MRGEVDDRESPQADARAEPGEVRPLAAVERLLDVGPRGERRADVVVRDRLLDRRRDGALTRQREAEALEAALGAHADERELAVLHHPVAEDDRLGERGSHRRNLELTDRFRHERFLPTLAERNVQHYYHSRNVTTGAL